MSEPRDPDEQALSDLIRHHATRHRAGPALESALRTELALHAAASRQPAPAPARNWPSWLLAGAGFVGGLVLSAGVALLVTRVGDDERLEAELVGSHVRALMANHLTDVASTDQHSVKPWFQGRLAYAPPVRDLAGEGFALVGGRLDYVAGQPVAAVVYRRNGHFINLFAWPTGGASASGAATRQGYNLVHWNEKGMHYAAVSDLNPGELRAFSELLR